MANVQMEKIQLIGLAKHRKDILELLQKKAALQIIEQKEDLSMTELHTEDRINDLDLTIANLDFAINLLKPYERKRGILEGPLTFSSATVKEVAKSFNHKDVVEQCRAVEDELAKYALTKSTAEQDLETLTPWKGLSFDLPKDRESAYAKITFIALPASEYPKLVEALKKESDNFTLEKTSAEGNTTYLAIIFDRQHEQAVQRLVTEHKGQEIDLSRDFGNIKNDIKTLKKTIKEADKQTEKELAKLQELASNSDNLKMMFDHFTWQKELFQAKSLLAHTPNTFALTGWMPKKYRQELEDDLHKITNLYHIENVELEEGETPPVAIANSSFITPFESVTGIYGLPRHDELDPTPFLSAFFILFFALCLTDSGYGLLLFILTFSALKFMKIPKQSQKLVRLIMYGGIVTFIAGIFFGGWFGLTIDQAPEFLTTTAVDPETGEVIKKFKGQVINITEGSGPLTFLILSFGLGILHVMFGIAVDGYAKLKKKKYMDALLDSALWVSFLAFMVLFALAKTGAVLAAQADLLTNIVLIHVGLLILTQGRKSKGIVGKVGLGVLSLYNLVGYVSDVLSYSRIMALGLGTGIIAFAMNSIASMAGQIPYVGIILMIIVAILGHTVNIALSTLGSFIHSGRLQFVEFFGKFIEGGGKAFKPLQRKGKYISISS